MTTTPNFGKKAEFKRPNAITVCFQCVTDRSGSAALNVDFAANNNNSTDWQNKQTIQLTIDELSMLAAMFLRLEDNCNFAFHGTNKKKSLIAKRISSQNKDTQFNFSLYLEGQQCGFIFHNKRKKYSMFKLKIKQM